MNRILQHLGHCCPCERRRRDEQRLHRAAQHLQGLIDTEGVECYVSRVDDETGEPRLMLAVLCDWKLSRETPTAEAGERLERLAADLATAAARLEGGAA